MQAAADRQEALLEVMMEPQLGEALGKAGRRLVESRYGIHVTAPR